MNQWLAAGLDFLSNNSSAVGLAAAVILVGAALSHGWWCGAATSSASGIVAAWAQEPTRLLGRLLSSDRGRPAKELRLSDHVQTKRKNDPSPGDVRLTRRPAACVSGRQRLRRPLAGGRSAQLWFRFGGGCAGHRRVSSSGKTRVLGSATELQLGGDSRRRAWKRLDLSSQPGYHTTHITNIGDPYEDDHRTAR